MKTAQPSQRSATSRTRSKGRATVSIQELEVYRSAVQFLALATRFTTHIPEIHASRVEQLRRAALSIPIDIERASAHTSDADAAKHYTAARHSAMECIAVLDVLHALAVVESAEHDRAMDLLGKITAMLPQLTP